MKMIILPLVNRLFFFLFFMVSYIFRAYWSLRNLGTKDMRDALIFIAKILWIVLKQ